MPADDGLRLDDVERYTPIGPEVGKEVPESPVPPAQARAARVALKHFDLVVQGEFLQGQGVPGSERGQQFWQHPSG